MKVAWYKQIFLVRLPWHLTHVSNIHFKTCLIVLGMLHCNQTPSAGARIASKLRQEYLRAALHQDIPHYDTELTSGDVVAGLNADCTAVQNAISEKVGNCIHHITTVVASLVVAIARGWKLALVMIALMPLIAMAGGILAKLMTSGTKKQAEAFSKANGMSSQAILNMRTVQSFQAEPGILKQFTDLLDYPRKISIQLSTYSGMASGVVNAVVFLTYAPLLSASPLHCEELFMRVISVQLCCGNSVASGAGQRVLLRSIVAESKLPESLWYAMPSLNACYEACFHMKWSMQVRNCVLVRWPAGARRGRGLLRREGDERHLRGHHCWVLSWTSCSQLWGVCQRCDVNNCDTGVCATRAPQLTRAIVAAGRSAGYRLRKVIDRKPSINMEDDGVVPAEAMKVQFHQTCCTALAFLDM